MANVYRIMHKSECPGHECERANLHVGTRVHVLEERLWGETDSQQPAYMGLSRK